MKLITKKDEDGNVWLLLGVSAVKKETDYESLIKQSITNGELSGKRATATEIAKACKLDSTRKPVIDAIAKSMRLMGFEERRRGDGKYFVLNKLEN
jgi:hypothetical protein